MSTPSQPVTSAMSPGDQISVITANLLQALQGELATLKQNNPGEISRILRLEPGLRKDAIKALLAQHIRTQLSPPGVTLSHRVKTTAPDQAGEKGAEILQKQEWAAAMQAFEGELTTAGLLGNPGGAYLYRNTSAPVNPAVVRSNGCFKHKDPSSAPADVIKHLFSGKAGTILANYTRDPGTLPFVVISATTDGDNTQGRSPTWSYAFPKPALTAVSNAAIAVYLGTLNATGGGTVLAKVRQDFPAASDAESVGKCLGTTFTLQTDTGALPGGLVAFVSSQGSQEHILLNTVAFTPGSDFFRCNTDDPTHPYRKLWKLLSQYPTYQSAVAAKNLPE